MIMKDSTFYNQESVQYSEKRYPAAARSYTQFFFKRRLAITKDYIRWVLRHDVVQPTLLEVGCADGVVLRDIEKTFPGVFGALVGIDIAPKMIEQARKSTVSANTEFFTRDAYVGTGSVAVVVEVGVVNYTNFEEELAFAHSRLKSGGFYILSVAGTGSLRNRLKHEGGFNDFRSYAEYERLISGKFTVRQVRGCGFFVPYLWRFPVLGKVVQSVLDPMIGFLAPGLCHEKVYLLEKK